MDQSLQLDHGVVGRDEQQYRPKRMLLCLSTSKKLISVGAVVVAQLAEWLLPQAELHSWNPIIGKIL